MNQINKKLFVICVIIFTQFFNSCFPDSVTCEESLNYSLNDNANITLTKLSNNWGGYRIDYEGFSNDNGKKIRFRTNDTHYSCVSEFVEKKDTLIKNMGTSNFLLLKRDSLIVFSFYCEDNYRNKDLLIFKRPLSKKDSVAIKKLIN